jgi:sulfocyanin
LNENSQTTEDTDMKKHYALWFGSMLLLPILAGCGNTTTASPGTTSYGAAPSNSGSNGSAAPAPAATPSNVTWLHVDKDNKTVTLDITSAQTNDNNGFNFNGYSNGSMTVTVPLNWTVAVMFVNKSSSMPHSLVVVPYANRTSSGGFQPAFTGASTPQPEAGILAGPMQHIAFTANKEGKYAFVCGIPGHASSGLWDTFNVSSSATIPTVSLNATSGSTDSSDGGYY